MANASFVQSSFLGGLWSAAAQGRMDLPTYREALSECLNYVVLEEGSLQRRSGTTDNGVTLGNGIIVEFWLPNNIACVLEFTVGHLRFWMPNTGTGRPYANTYTLGGTISSSTPYSTINIVELVRVVQADNLAFIICQGQAPLILTCTNYSSITDVSITPTFTLKAAALWRADGPYLDPSPGLSLTGNSIGQISDNSFTPTFTIIDGSYVFISSDVNRAIRMWSQPPLWDGATAYSEGTYVTYNGSYWVSVVGGSLTFGIPPGAVTQPPSGSTQVPTQVWALAPQAGQWTYGFISAVLTGATCTVTILSSTSVPTINNGYVISTWQLGVYTSNVQPSCGTYHEGRVWLAGASPNRLDACMTNQLVNAAGGYEPLFSPTDPNGNVLDDSGITYSVNSTGSNLFLWMMPDHQGILAGTASGEWLISASTLNDPLTPTSIQAHRVTAYKTQNSEPVRAGIGLAFIQAFGRRLLEYVVDVFSQKFIGRHLNAYSKGLTTAGIKKLSYQEELAPVVWCVGNSTFQSLIGCTYRRLSHFGQEAPTIMAWHRHQHGTEGRSIQWACTGTNSGGTEDVLMLLTQDKVGTYRLETMQPLFDEGQALWSGWFLDGAYPGSLLAGTITGGNLVISGLPSALNGLAGMGVWIAGLWAGLGTVAGGAITVPLGQDPDGYLTADYLYHQGTAVSGVSYGNLAMDVFNVDIHYTVPCVVGFTYNSTWTLNRPQTAADLRTETGPGLAKTRRIHQYGIQFVNAITGATIGVDDGPTQPMRFVEDDQQTSLDHTVLFDGVHWDTIDDDYSYDGQLTSTISAPYPQGIVAVTGFIHTQDR